MSKQKENEHVENWWHSPRRDFLKTSTLALTGMILADPLWAFSKLEHTTANADFDVLIIGGSYAGLSAAMTLGRSLQKVLIIDSGSPCNQQTPQAHNFITHDGQRPKVITNAAKTQVLKYPTVTFLNDMVSAGRKIDNGFEIGTEKGQLFKARKLVLATGIKDLLPAIKGISECWGISVIHCPYCHGYEVKQQVTGLLANGNAAMHLATLVSNLTQELQIFTNGKASFTQVQRDKLAIRKIPIIEKEIDCLEHDNGQLKKIIFKDGSFAPIQALYAKVPFVQHSNIAQNLGCKLQDNGLLVIDAMQQTTVPDVYACGDNCAAMRSLANAVAVGNFVGAVVNLELCKEKFNGW